MSYLSEPHFYDKVHALVRIYGLKNFVETGCGPLQDGLRVGQTLRLRCYSCDTQTDFVEAAHQRFPLEVVAPRKSIDFLRDMLRPVPIVNGPTLFFLDAHFPELEEYGSQRTDDIDRFPLLDELRYIKAHKKDVEHDVILCDDVRCIVDLENPRYDPKEMKDSPLAQSGATWKEYVSIFRDTHAWAVWPAHEGILAFIPRAA